MVLCSGMGFSRRHQDTEVVQRLPLMVRVMPSLINHGPNLILVHLRVPVPP